VTKFKSRRTLAALAVAVVGMGVGGVAIATAQTDADSPRAFFDAVARHLGISSEELEDATKAAAIEQVDAALEAGRITEEQAEQLKERIESGDGVPFFGPRLGFGFPGPHGLHGGFRLLAPGDQLSAAAEYLGLSVADLRQRVRGGESLADIAAAEDKSVDGLRQAMLAAVEEALDNAVEDGDVTQEQADRIFERVEAHIDDIINGAVFEEWHLRGFRGPSGDAPPAGAEFWGTSV
jgi:3-hydroxyacyl-CoA dehydrogenase